MQRTWWGILFFLLASCFITGQALAQTYFQNKTIRIIRGGEPGGTGDLQARALIPFLKKHIPGAPSPMG
jgi:tripartite-type tricarboxylate transporter receptor subunit TctC